ncbi:MAG: DUF3592 domain-containing protein [Gloeomargarita sp. GMQP_bins_120]
MAFWTVLWLVMPLLIIGLIAANYVRLIANFLQVLADGIETEAVIVDKTPRRGRRRFHRLVYEYTDQRGQVHRNHLDLFRSEYHNYQVGDRIAVVYSASRPHLSNTKAVVDRARQALRR